MLVHPIVQSKGPHIVDNAHEIVLEGTPQGHIKWSANIRYVRPLGSLELDTTINWDGAILIYGGKNEKGKTIDLILLQFIYQGHDWVWSDLTAVRLPINS